MSIRQVIILGSLTLVLSGCFWNNTPTLDLTSTPGPTSDTSLVHIDAAALTPELVAEFQTAAGLAKSWRSDAALVAASVSWPPTLQTGRAQRVYVFGSATVPADWWLVTFNEQTGERVRSLVPKEDYLGAALPTVPLEFWKLNAVEALQRAEAAGGGAFREKNPGAEVTASLARRGPNGWLWWVVSYRGLNDETATYRIHPSTGELYTDDGELLEPAS
ncbi:hypothetical protein HY523_02455 [Candidatus Berkelbacteria bacterium]|nr:hypothetical protein [Candidatus Berkelbacteria bacterium]